MADEQTGTGTSDASGAGGGNPAGFVPQDQFERAEAQRRDLQSQLDRMKAAEAARQTTPPEPPAPSSTSTGDSSVESELAAIKARLGSLDPNAFADAAMARFAQATALREAEAALKTEFPNARSEAFQGHSTPEEMRAAAAASHQTETQALDALRDKMRAELAAQIKETHGIDLAPPPQAPATSDGGGDTGPTTQRDLAGMSLSDLSKMSDEDVAKALART